MAPVAPFSVGTLLIAKPFMWDPHFQRTVILLCDHHPHGTLGFILNKPLQLSLNDLVDFPEHFHAEAYFGGPVQTDTLHFLHSVGHLLYGAQPVLPGVWWGGDFEQLRALADRQLITPEQVRFYVGYSGWSPRQLQAEIADHSWIVADGDPNYVFKYSGKHLWQLALQHKGSHFSVLSELPEKINWN